MGAGGYVRGLYAIPTRQRASRWWITSGDLTLEEEVDGTGRAVAGRLDFIPRARDRVTLFSWRCDAQADVAFRNRPKAVLAVFSNRGPVVPARLLIREVRRPGFVPPRSVDVVVSPDDTLTVSIISEIEGCRSPEAARSLVKTLLSISEPLPWPEWIPNDETMEEVDRLLPAHVDHAVWAAMRAAVYTAMPLEEDQFFYNLRLDALETDSLDTVVMAMQLEEDLDLTLDDDEVEQLFAGSVTLGDVHDALVAILRQRSRPLAT